MQSTCKLAFIWTKQTYPYNQGYIYVGQDQAIRTNKDIYVVKRWKHRYFVWIAPTDTSSNSVQQQNSSRDLKGRETRKQGTQPQHPAPCET